jgi:hypothetical protein
VSVWAQQRREPWETWLDLGSVRVTTAWRRYEVGAPCSGDDDAAALQVGVGQATGSVWLDDVRLQRGSREVWRRDYERGVVLVNASAAVRAVTLGGTFKRLRGAQAPAVNDGGYGTRVALPARDGLILLRATAEEASAARALDAAVAKWAGCVGGAARARCWYAAKARRAAGSVRARLSRAREAWARAARVAAAVRARLTAARSSFRSGALVAARARLELARADAASASARVRSAWARGHAVASRAPAARRMAAGGLRAVRAAAAALAAVP